MPSCAIELLEAIAMARSPVQLECRDTFAPIVDTSVMQNTLWCAAVLAIACTTASAAPLPSTITPLSPESPVVVTDASSGRTPLERYRAPIPVRRADRAVVAMVKLPLANDPDVITVTDARRVGRAIEISIEARRFDGILTANRTNIPLVEIELGLLPAGDFELHIVVRDLHFTGSPSTAANPITTLDWHERIAVR